MQGLEYRLREIFPAPPKHTLLLDASAGLSLGALPGLEDFGAGVAPVLPWLDGLVCSPGQLRRLKNRPRADAALLVRTDWTNTLREASFPLAVETPNRLAILEAPDALDLGAAAMVSTFLLGYEESVEAGCLKSTVQLALTGKAVGLPLVVEVRTTGPRVVLPGKAVELGASYALEGGADAVVVPYPGEASLETIGSFCSVPWLLKPTSIESVPAEWEQAAAFGAAGLWLDHTWLTAAGKESLQELSGRLHAVPAQE
jgi:DhnA family fructose-bisphosphate aldolase class Ia